jgi:hypothetical protein
LYARFKDMKIWLKATRGWGNNAFEDENGEMAYDVPSIERRSPASLMKGYLYSTAPDLSKILMDWEERATPCSESMRRRGIHMKNTSETNDIYSMYRYCHSHLSFAITHSAFSAANILSRLAPGTRSE